MRVVVDTNVIVAGLLSPFHAAGEVVSMASSGTLVLCYDSRIISEYREVLSRPKFQFDQSQVDDLVLFLQSNGEVTSAQPLPVRLPDSHDEMFLEVAVAAQSRCLITGNLKHFPTSKRQGITVASPAEFIEIYRKELKNSRDTY